MCFDIYIFSLTIYICMYVRFAALCAVFGTHKLGKVLVLCASWFSVCTSVCIYAYDCVCVCVCVYMCVRVCVLVPMCVLAFTYSLFCVRFLCLYHVRVDLHMCFWYTYVD